VILPLVFPTVVHMLVDAAVRNPSGEALVCGDERLDYAGYLAAVAGLAAELEVYRGQRIVLLLGNSIDIAVATLAVQAAGAQVVPLNPAYTTRPWCCTAWK
jgi:long-chain acyl-CoA synthetase